MTGSPSETPSPPQDPGKPDAAKEKLRSGYEERAAGFSESIRRETRNINYIALARLAALVAAIWVLVLGIRHQSVPLYALALILTAGFLYLVSLHNRRNQQRELFRHLQALNETELECLEHRFHHNPDGGKFADPAHAWSHDLDLFGPGSLFQYLNRTSTLRGEEILADRLTTEPDGPDDVLHRQGIVGDLINRLDFRQFYTGKGRTVMEEPGDRDDLSRWVNDRAYIRSQGWLFYLALVMSALSLGMVTGLILGAVSIWGLLTVSLVNFSILSPYLMRTNQYQAAVSRKHLLLEGYARLLGHIAGEPFEHSELQEKARHASEGMREVAALSRLLNLFDQRLNMLLGAILNGLFLFDFIMIRLLENWKEKNSRHILEWIELIGWTDAMVSLGGFSYNHPSFTLPELGSSRRSQEQMKPGTEKKEEKELSQEDLEQEELELRELGHPLIPDRKRVDNDLRIDSEKVVVITGANMAGKSTFLRSLGVNLVLAYTGCPVCAAVFRTPYMGLCSSMRTADSLKDEESYFLAEIRKLQVIVQRMEKGESLMILLDEVLKGTNTTDKKKGSEGLIRRAIRYPVRCFIATHDLSLGELEKQHPGEVVNYCFESYIHGMELTFDYTIRKGIATNMNASFLMKKMGIMD